MAFRFRHFTVEDDRSTLKVGTDAMLLGAWVDPGDATRILDIGTGCGLLALMIAQKSVASIDAIDIDKPSVDQAKENFINSPWPGRLNAFCHSLFDFQSTSGEPYDYIISNPPYFKNHLRSVSRTVNITKHDEGLKTETLIKMVHRLLIPDGRFSVIFPYANQNTIINICKDYGFHLTKQVIVHSKPGIRPGRTLMEFGRSAMNNPVTTKLCILDINGKFSNDYLGLTAGYHCF